ncbi:phage tail protein [Pseudomonas sp. GG8]
MTMYWSRTAHGFYDSEIHKADQIPEDAMEIELARHAELMEGQTAGKCINFDAVDGPELIDHPPMSPEQLAEVERIWRGVQLATTDGVVARHRDELESGGPSTLTAEQYVELQVYRRQLRDWPQGIEFPLVEHRPVAPSWLAEQDQ